MNALREGMAAFKAGDRARAQALLLGHVERNPDSEEGWLLLAAVVDTPEEAMACLEHALLINPRSRRAKAGLEWARARAGQPLEPTPSAAPVPEPPPSPEPALPSESTPSGLLRRLATPISPPTTKRRTSPYAPTRLFTEADLARLAEMSGEPPLAREAVPEPPAAPEVDRLSTWQAPPAEEAAVPAWEAPPEMPGAEVEEALEPPPSLADRLGAWGAPPEEPAAPVWEAPQEEPVVPVWEVPSEEPVVPVWEAPLEMPGAEVEEPLEPPPSLADRLGAWGAPPEEPAVPTWEAPPEPPGVEAEEPLGPPPSLADRLGAWGTPPEEPAAPAWETPSEPLGVEAEEPLGPPPSLADRLGAWGAPSPEEPAAPRPVERPVEPGEPAVSASIMSERLDRLETSLTASGILATDAPTPAASLSERLRQLRGDFPAAPVETPRPTATMEELMARGEGALEAGQVGEAERAFRQALELDPDHPEVHANLAMVHYINERRAEAIAELKIAVQRRPDYEDALYTLGVILNEVGRVDEAVSTWREVLRLNPAHAEAQRELQQASAVTTTAERPAAEGIRCPNCNGVVLTTVSTCPHCDYELFTICPRCKEYVPADSRLCPRCNYALKGVGSAAVTGEDATRQTAEVHTRLGLAHLEGGRVADALREWQEAIATDPTYAVPHFYMGLLFIEQRQVDNAVDAFQKALRLDPDYTEAYLELGMIYLAQNKRNAARRAFEECLKRQPREEIRREAQTQLAALR